MQLPADAQELGIECSGEGWPDCLAIYRDKGGTIYITGYHFGPGPAILVVRPDGKVERPD